MSLHHEVSDFLFLRGWTEIKETDNFIYFSSPDDKISLRIPVDDSYSDYVTFMSDIVKVIKNLYPKSYNHPRSRIKKVIMKLDHMKHKYSTKKKDWILPEVKSKIQSITIDTVYIPKKFLK